MFSHSPYSTSVDAIASHVSLILIPIPSIAVAFPTPCFRSARAFSV